MTLELIFFSMLSASAIVTAGLLFHDFQKLRNALTSLARGHPCQPRLEFFSGRAASLWLQMKSLHAIRNGLQMPRPALSEVLTAGREIVRNVRHEHGPAESTCALLLRYLAPEISAAGVALLDREGRLRLVATLGVSKQRIEAALLSHIECAFDPSDRSEGLSRRSEHVIPQPHSALDFSAFGLGPSYFALVREEEHFAGFIWLGFRRESTTLPKDKMLFIQALAQHCAASFSVAKHVEKKIAEHDRERRWLLGMSHDLRAPGNSALYSLRDVLSEEAGPLTAEQRLRLEIIEDCLKDQIDLVGDILDLAKFRQGFLEAMPRGISLAAVLPGYVQPFFAEAERKSIAIQISAAPDLVCSVDPRHLKRIIVNLLTNALKYTDSGSIRLSCAAAGQTVRISVADTGIGISSLEASQLFQEFCRLENSEARPGIGLGLSIAKTLCERNGGTIIFTPNPGGGSIFSVSLPSAAAEAPAQPIFDCILIIEDDGPAGRTHARYLKDLARHVVTVFTAAEAIEAFSRHRPEVVVTDLYLEMETSEALIAYLRAESAELKIVVATGSGDSALLDSLERAGHVSILRKPFDRSALQQAIALPALP